MEIMAGKLLEQAREIPILADADIIVAGGGPSGWTAAVAAARMGKDVLLIENGAYLGGNLNLPGLALLAALDWSGRPIIAGLMQELIDRLVSVGGATGHFPCPKHLSMCALDPEMVRFTLLEMAHEAGVHILLHSAIADVVREGHRLSAIIAEGKNGRFAIRGKVFVDASGDADLVARAGARVEKGKAANGQLQPMTLTFRLGNCDPDALIAHLEQHPEDLNRFNQPPQEYPVEHLRKYPYWTITGLAGLAARARDKGDFPRDLGYVNITPLPRRGQVGINAARVFSLDGTDVWDLTRGELEGRRKALLMTTFFQRHVPGFADCVLLDMAPRIGVRETRHIVGLTTLTEQDIRSRRVFPDAIAQGIYPIDIHSQDASPSTFILLEEPYTIPYRALIPADLENVIVAGRAISADRVAFGSLRVMSHCMAIGHAAGVAAALTLKGRRICAETDATDIQTALLEQKALIGVSPQKSSAG